MPFQHITKWSFCVRTTHLLGPSSSASYIIENLHNLHRITDYISYCVIMSLDNINLVNVLHMPIAWSV